MRKLRENIKLFNVKGIDMLGNPRTGAIIGLTQSGRLFIESLYNDGVDATESYSGEQYSIVQALETMDFIDTGDSDIPLRSAYVHLTDHCNLHCIGCYSLVDDRNKHQDLSGDQFLALLDKLAASGVRQVVFSGGEPTMHHDTPRIAQHAKSLGMRVILITNGTIAPKRVLSIVPYLDVLSVSIDGYDNDSTFLRDPGIMNRILSFIEEMKKHTNVHLIVTLHRQNVPFMLKYVELARQEKVTFNFSILTVAPDDPTCADFILRDPDLAEISRVMNETEDLYVEESVLARLKDGSFALTCVDRCGVACKLVSVAADGSVYPCHMLHNDQLVLGNIINEDLPTILQRGRYIADITVDEIEECMDCQFKYLCGGGCRARSFLYYGDFYHRDPFCPMTFGFLDAQTDKFEELTTV